MAVKRLHYYDQQFLVEADFTDEQKYHVDMRRRLNNLLHGFGIAQGLEVIRTGARQVTVKAGGAIDRNGRELILEADTNIDLSNLTTFPGNTPVFVTIAYQESQTDPSTATGASGNTRITEAPMAQASTTAPPTDGTVVRLAQFTKTAAGDVPGNLNDALDGGVRQSVSAKIGPAAVDNTNLAPPLAGRITTLETHAANTNNPHATTAVQVGALPLAGGTIAANLQVNGSLGIATAPATRLHVVGTAPAIRLTDGNQASGRILVSDANGGGTWKDNSRYFVSGGLAVTSVVASPTAVRLGDFVVFAKATAESTVEVNLNTRAGSGVFASGANAVFFQVRIDNAVSPMSNEAACTTSNTIEYIGIFAVFQGLAAGTHTVSVFARTALGTSTGVILDPGNFGGRIVVKETF
jgi:hypothetical protein